MLWRLIIAGLLIAKLGTGFAERPNEGVSEESSTPNPACSGHGRLFCSCALEYTGVHCETFVNSGACADPPFDNPLFCGNGHCESTGSTTRCACDYGYTGVFCKIPYVLAKRCALYSTPEVKASNLTVGCPPGDHCLTDDLKCAFDKCSCPIGYCIPKPTSEPRPLSYTQFDLSGSASNLSCQHGEAICLCSDGYVGEYCSEIDPLLRNGIIGSVVALCLVLLCSCSLIVLLRRRRISNERRSLVVRRSGVQDILTELRSISAVDRILSVRLDGGFELPPGVLVTNSLEILGGGAYGVVMKHCSGIMRELADEPHSHLMRAYGVVDQSEQGVGQALVLELCAGSLLSLLRQGVPMEPRQQSRILWQVADGATFLAAKSILHRDLAARNVLYSEGLKVKIADFGLSVRLPEGQTEVVWDSSTALQLPAKWMPPEALREKRSSLAGDVWAFGVLCWEVLSSGRPPYADVSPAAVLAHLDSRNRLRIPQSCPEQLRQLLVRSWSKKPSERPTMDDAKAVLESTIIDLTSEEYNYLEISAAYTSV